MKRIYVTKNINYVIRFGHYPEPEEGFIIVFVVNAVDHPSPVVTLKPQQRGGNREPPANTCMTKGGPFGMSDSKTKGVAATELPPLPLEDGYIAGMITRVIFGDGAQ